MERQDGHRAADQAAYRKALPYAEVLQAIATVRNARHGSVSAKLALEFLILTAARSGEVRGATWGGIDWQAGTWTIPADRMKATITAWTRPCMAFAPRFETGPPSMALRGTLPRRALAHTVRNAVEAAYLRADYLEKRRAVMADWAAHCEPTKTHVAIAAKRRREREEAAAV